jgi:hypothetical protein
MLTTLFIVAQLILAQTFGATEVIYGDPNVEQWPDTIGGDMVQAYTVIIVNAPTLITSVSMFLQYSGSDGSQCMYFGIYPDNGSGSPAGSTLVTATKQAYCLKGGSTWGPAWQTWNLTPSDYMTVQPGTYWLCTLAKQTFGTVYHYSYASGADWSYGTSAYYFAATFDNGFPQFFSSHPASSTEGPYSFYVTGITA